MRLIAVTVLTLLAAGGYTPVAVPAAVVLLCWWPGWIISRLAGLGRGWDALGRAVLNVALSLVFAPIFLHALWHAGHGRGLLLGSIWGTLTLGLLALRVSRRSDPSDARGRVPAHRFIERPAAAIWMSLIGLLVVFSTIGPYWPSAARGYPVPAAIHDFIKHHAVLFALEQSPLPLGNPFYAAEARGPVYYYHFFYLIPATVRAVSGGPGIELAFGIHGALVALATICCLVMIVKRFTGGEPPAMLAALLATVVGAPDILPVLARRLTVITLDAWADHVVRIHNLFNQMIWSPQNMLGLLVVLVVVFLLSEKGCGRVWLILGPLAGMAAWGSSPWVALVLFGGFGAWWIHAACARPASRSGPAVPLIGATVTGVSAALLAVPLVWGYAQMSQRHGKGLTAEWPHQWNAWLGRLVPPGPLANLLDLPWVLAVEFGPLLLFPLLLVPRAVWRRAWSDPGLRLLMLCAPVATVGFVCVRSHFMYNDFGQKTMMVAMAAGVVLAACAVRPESVRPGLLNPVGWSLHPAGSRTQRWLARALFVALIILGLPMGLYEAPLTAVRRYLPAGGRLGVLLPETSRLAAVEGPAWAWMQRNLPADAVVQADPGQARVPLQQVIDRQIGVMVLEADTMVFYPADEQAHARRLANLQQALNESSAAEALHAALADCLVTHVFVGSIERAGWKNLDALANRRYFEPIYEQASGTVYALQADIGPASRTGEPAQTNGSSTPNRMRIENGWQPHQDRISVGDGCVVGVRPADGGLGRHAPGHHHRRV